MKESKEFINKVARITFDEFKEMAKNTSLSSHNKIGFPDSYRLGYTDVILKDIMEKLQLLSGTKKRILDIGCGCDELATSLIEKSAEYGHELYMIDSKEMLDLLPQKDSVKKISMKFPQDEAFFEKYTADGGFFDAILVYSVMQHVILEDNPFHFIDQAVRLLAPGGRLLLGDLPNISKRKRFFLSPRGIKTHQNYTNSDEIPEVDILSLEMDKLDDSQIFAILQRYRSAGFESYLLPQGDALPLSTRREDILIVKPD